MANWIFQANPDLFDVDRYIERQDEIACLVKRYGERMNPGDRVCLWRAQGRNKTYRNKIYGEAITLKQR